MRRAGAPGAARSRRPRGPRHRRPDLVARRGRGAPGRGLAPGARVPRQRDHGLAGAAGVSPRGGTAGGPPRPCGSRLPGARCARAARGGLVGRGPRAGPAPDRSAMAGRGGAGSGGHRSHRPERGLLVIGRPGPAPRGARRRHRHRSMVRLERPGRPGPGPRTRRPEPRLHHSRRPWHGGDPRDGGRPPPPTPLGDLGRHRPGRRGVSGVQWRVGVVRLRSHHGDVPGQGGSSPGRRRPPTRRRDRGPRRHDLHLRLPFASGVPDPARADPRAGGGGGRRFAGVPEPAGDGPLPGRTDPLSRRLLPRPAPGRARDRNGDRASSPPRGRPCSGSTGWRAEVRVGSSPCRMGSPRPG